MNTIPNLSLANYTSFRCGGAAETAVFFDTINSNSKTITALSKPLHVLGFGSNSLVSDAGLPGTTLILRTGSIERHENVLVADAGVWWDDLVTYAIDRSLWGLEFTSAIPGSVGAAVVGNIAAYGMAVSDTLAWVDVFDTTSGSTERLAADALDLEYRMSRRLQHHRELIVMRAAFALSDRPTKDLEYESAATIAREKSYDLSTLQGRRQTIIDARARAGSLWDYRDDCAARTAGSFFRNPLVDAETAERIMDFDETGKSHELLRTMNQLHGGSSRRVSAALVLLAAGFSRGQTWGDVRLHPSNLLKIENIGHASAQEIYTVAQEIILTVKKRLDIDIEPEVRFLGSFA